MASNKKYNTGAWLIHHDQKLSGVRSNEFENITTSGRAARLLSCVSKEVDWTVSDSRVQALAAANGIKKHEIPGLLAELKSAGLIDLATGGGIAVLGITQANLFQHAADVFEQQNPTGLERAAIELADRASDVPLSEKAASDEMADIYKLSKAESVDLIVLAKTIGFVDHEPTVDEILLFNGSLFKRDEVGKSKVVLDTLTANERQAMSDVDERLTRSGCLPEDIVKRILGDKLWSKLHQIGFLQVSTVTNETGSTKFVTKPAALVKYVPGGLGDMLDDAKALASSLTYGILKSNRTRGQIMTPDRLMGALIGRGYVEGWANAIVQDYQVLERRGVVETSQGPNGFRLTLLKTEVGQMAQDLILKGDASEATAAAVVGSQPANYSGPEVARTAERLKDIPETKRAASSALDALRKSR
jgi:hypothetical protein